MRLNALKGLVASGQYEVDADAVADALMSACGGRFDLLAAAVTRGVQSR